ncbi:uncharacterized protein JCM6883_003683 [Sporobolomyces salmoneus]|uniref:uncharacterized protein n=1 Tax=Sporobolomyces salmoneus TaxID=183962 RepID=UPI003176DA74
MKPRDDTRTDTIEIRDDQVVNHLLPTLPFRPRTLQALSFPSPTLLGKDTSLDLERPAEEPPPPAYPNGNQSKPACWKKVGRIVRVIFCGGPGLA